MLKLVVNNEEEDDEEVIAAKPGRGGPRDGDWLSPMASGTEFLVRDKTGHQPRWLVNEFTQVIKGTPLVSVIAVVELMRIAQQIYNDNFRPLEVLLGVAIIFFAMNFTLLRVSSHIERRNPVR